jgi:thiol-disulfide isomerase/thioredoxin
MADSNRSNRPLSRRIVGWLLQALVLLGVIILVHLWQTRAVVSGIAPPLNGHTLQGEHVDLATNHEGPLVIHFWATWCPVCRLELDNIAALQPEHRVITLAMMSGTDGEILDYLKETKIDFPVISDPQGSIAQNWGVTGVPATFILDGEGRIRFVEVGYTTTLGLRARLWLAR